MDSTSPEAPRSSLVVENDLKLCTLLALTLRWVGYVVVLASSGEDPLDLIAAADFDRLYCTIKHLTKPSLDEALGDQGRGKHQEGGMDVASPVIADGKAAELSIPSKCALRDPAGKSQSCATLRAKPSDGRVNVASG